MLACGFSQRGVLEPVSERSTWVDGLKGAPPDHHEQNHQQDVRDVKDLEGEFNVQSLLLIGATATLKLLRQHGGFGEQPVFKLSFYVLFDCSRRRAKIELLVLRFDGFCHLASQNLELLVA